MISSCTLPKNQEARLCRRLLSICRIRLSHAILIHAWRVTPSRWHSASICRSRFSEKSTFTRCLARYCPVKYVETSSPLSARSAISSISTLLREERLPDFLRIGLFLYIGFEVESLEEIAQKLAAAGCERREDINQALGLSMGKNPHGNAEVRYSGPDGVMFDVSQTGWVGTSRSVHHAEKKEGGHHG
jgi:hypothetical protein